MTKNRMSYFTVINELSNEEIHKLFDYRMGGTGAVERIECVGDEKWVFVQENNPDLDYKDDFYQCFENGPREFYKGKYPWFRDQEPLWYPVSLTSPPVASEEIVDNRVYVVRFVRENN